MLLDIILGFHPASPHTMYKSCKKPPSKYPQTELVSKTSIKLLNRYLVKNIEKKA